MVFLCIEQSKCISSSGMRTKWTSTLEKNGEKICGWMAVVPLSTYKKSCVPSRSLLLPLPHINRQSLVCTAKKTSTLQKTSCSESAGRKKQRILFFVGAGRRLLVTASSATGLMGRSSPLYDFLVVAKK